MLAFLTWRRGRAVLRPTRRQLLSCFAVGTLLMGANAVVSVAEVDVPSSMAALLIASVPLWVILYRRALGDRVAGISVAAVLVGFVGVALLLLPGKQTGGAPLLALLTVVAAAAMWAGGSVASTRLTLPRDPFVSSAWQMLLGGGVCALTGVLTGELGDFHPADFSARSLIGFAYLVVFGSWLAFAAYAWLLQNAPVSRVATYAYVNPVVAIALGWAILGEAVTKTTFVGAAVIVASVAAVVRTEARRSNSR
jgi:drug/metabolite transporter (DMT)-like permease